ncbi:MAG TPA: hypothetical protein VLA52_05405, partial [Thermohalobaculum sp.]|nr:hypothetical protein [Thermohalobaculum sp.]
MADADRMGPGGLFSERADWHATARFLKSFAGAIGLSMVLIGAAAGPGSTAPFEDRPGAGPSVPPGAAVSQAARGDANDDGIEDGLSAQIAAGPPNA